MKDCKGENNGFYGKVHSVETREKMRVAHARRKKLGLYMPMSEVTKKRISVSTTGRIAHNKGVKTVAYKNCESCSKQYYVKSHGDLERRRFCSLKCLGDFNSKRMKGAGAPNWKGGITPASKAARCTREYREWRKAVFSRDSYTCQECGARSGKGKAVYLHADHIKPFAYYPELRLIVENGRTLCEPCHRLTPTYGGRIAWSLT